MMKREREVDSVTMANYLMLLSAGGEFENRNYLNYSSGHRVFECKTCKRQFPSFQALGGHRASHKKPRLTMGESEHSHVLDASPPKPKTHECSICGLEFAIGQALGGHMRRHRTSSSSSSSNGNMNNATTVHKTSSTKMNSSNERVLFPDLNLTPLENDLEFLKIRQPAPLVHCFN
ncbi:zinc finger protein ZAT11-like [Vigna unguiculata]|uniref:zinc finger protein ZAT11-like n=1 Tax=Vigna unguiculata TaxID=3917 RepID=UPI00101697B9|nr:zinc finger protein ZAT11-like [Vigna unguiculata]